MEVQTPNEQIEVKPKKTFTGVLFDIFSFFALPFRYLRKVISIVREDNAKISQFKAWKKRESLRKRRQGRLSDEF
jgi:hypothetical protein